MTPMWIPRLPSVRIPWSDSQSRFPPLALCQWITEDVARRSCVPRSFPLPRLGTSYRLVFLMADGYLSELWERYLTHNLGRIFLSETDSQWSYSVRHKKIIVFEVINGKLIDSSKPMA